MANDRYVLRAKARFILIQACVEFEKEHGNLTPAEWLWIFQSEQRALVEKLLQEQKSVESTDDQH